MRVPGRLHITWADDTTLKIETDAGTQTRLLRFGAAARARAPHGRASRPRSGRAGRRRTRTAGTRPGGPGGCPEGRDRADPPRLPASNGVPYSGDAVMTEYFDVVSEPNGDQWLVVEAIVEDPRYLTRSFIRSTHFKKQADGSGWDPSPCR